MNHALVYHGSFEQNFESLRPGTSTYVASSGNQPPVTIASPEVDGIVIGYMERAGKRFVAVRVRFENGDVVLENPVVLERVRHLGGRRFAPRPTLVTDDLLSVIMDDILAANPRREPELALLLNRVNQVRRGERESIE
jgi:hypothetical protein